jgi:Caspase domain
MIYSRPQSIDNYKNYNHYFLTITLKFFKTMKQVFFSITTFCMMLFAASNVSAQTFHAVIIEGEGSYISLTAELYENEITRIATTLRMRPSIVRVKASSGRVLSSLDAINASADDIIWVVAAGHGAGAGDGYSTIRVKNAQGTDMKLDLSHVVDNYLVNSPAHLSIIGYDVCNHGNITRNPALDQPYASVPVTLYKKLFKESTGVVRMRSSKPGNFSYEAEGMGGLFSNSLFESINDANCYGNTGAESWEKVNARTRTLTNQKDVALSRTVQDPAVNFTPKNTGNRAAPTVAPVTPPQEEFRARSVDQTTSSSSTPDDDVRELAEPPKREPKRKN